LCSVSEKLYRKERRLPIVKFGKALGVGRRAKVFLILQAGLTRGKVPDLEYPNKQVEVLENAREKQRQTLRELKEEQRQTLRELKNARRRNSRQANKLREQKLEIFQLRTERQAVDELLDNAQHVSSTPRKSRGPEVGALPDFVVIGAQKCGTTTFYGLLGKHPNVERAAINEVHYFDRSENFAKGTEWYRRCFPAPQRKNGHRSITGEKTPSYLFHLRVPERMAEVVPQARLIVLLRNPVDRAYSHYHHLLRMGGRLRTFEEAIESEQARLSHKPGELSEQGYGSEAGPKPPNLLARGIYVDQLQRWSKFFDDEQMLVLKSEDFYKHTADTMKSVLEFLGLPHQEFAPPPREDGKRYEAMNPSIRRRLEAYFEPHNQRLYAYLGMDFGW
jgi:hypothetical protein